MNDAIKLKIQVLRAARNIMITLPSQYGICAAIMRATVGSDQAASNAGYDLRRYVVGAIAPHRYLDNWIQANRPWCEFPVGPYNMRSYRIQYIDWMIRQLEDQL